MLKMKKYLFYIIAVVLFAGSCKQDEISRIAPTGEFDVYFDFPQGPINAPAKLVLTNRSRFSDKFLWEFPQGKTLTKAGLQDISSSTKVIPDTIVYALPGTYKIKLTAWQGGKMDSITKELVVTKRRPSIIAPANIEVFNDYQFQAVAFKFPDKNITFSWDFDEPGLVSTQENPTVAFQREGLHNVTLTVNDGEETLTVTRVVDVKGELAKSLYFTDAITQKIYRLSFAQNAVVQQTPISTTLHPLSISVYNNRIYVVETGKGLRFSSGVNAAPDGNITSYNINGTNPVILTRSSVSAATVDYRNDPWMHTFDNSGNIWFTERNGGVRTLPANAVEAQYPLSKFALTAANAGVSTATYFDGDVKFVNNEIWLSKTGTTGKGIWRFNTNGDFIAPLGGSIMNYAIRAFVVDQVHGKIYFTVNVGAYGLYQSNLDGNNVVAIDNGASMQVGANAFSQEGSANEWVYITGLALNLDSSLPTGGYLYYGYRSDLDITGDPNVPTIRNNPATNSGVKIYPLDGSAAPSFIPATRGYAPYGIAIDNVRR
jgi:PKD repeat protein